MTWSPDLIDLTRPMTRETIVELAGKLVAEPSPYNEVELSYLRSWDTDNGSLCQWKLNDHFGTHLDAPIHIVPNSDSVDRVDINRLIGEAVVIDCSFGNGRGLTSEDFERARPRVKAGDIVLVYSAEQPGSLEDWIHDQTYVTPDGAEWLVKQGIKSVGVEPFGFEHLYDGLFVKKYYDKATPRRTGRRTRSASRRTSTSWRARQPGGDRRQAGSLLRAAAPGARVERLAGARGRLGRVGDGR